MTLELLALEAQAPQGKRLRAWAVFGAACLSLVTTACSSNKDPIVPLEAGLASINARGEVTIQGCLYQNGPAQNPANNVTVLRRLLLVTGGIAGKDQHVQAVIVPMVTYTDPTKNRPQAIPINGVPSYSFVDAAVDTRPYGVECTVTIGQEEVVATGLGRFGGTVVRFARQPDGTAIVSGPFTADVVADPGGCSSSFRTSAPAGAIGAATSCLTSVVIGMPGVQG